MKKYLILLSLLVFAWCSSGFAQTFEWAKQMGGANNQKGLGITTDAMGNVYVTGKFAGSPDFDPGPGTVTLTSLGIFDAFVAKLDAAGDLVWVKQFGSTSSLGGTDIVADASGNVYVTGDFNNSADFDPGAGVHTLTSNGTSDIFVAKLDASGNFVWAHNIGGSNYDYGDGITLDAAGKVRVAGRFSNTVDFDPSAGTFDLTSNGQKDVFVLKLGPSGSFLSAFGFGSGTDDGVPYIKTDASNNVYVTGTYKYTVDFDPGPGTVSLSSTASSWDIFVCKYTEADTLLWAKNIGGAENGTAGGLFVESSGDVLITGHHGGTFDLDPGIDTVSSIADSAGQNAFLVQWDKDGVYEWIATVSGDDRVNAMEVNKSSNGKVYWQGLYTGTADFDPGAGTVNSTSLGDWDIFLSEFDSTGAYVTSWFVGGSERDVAEAMTINATGNVYSVGWFEGTCDFDPGSGSLNLTAGGQNDIFVHKMGVPVTGVIAPAETNKARIFPNPANEKFSILSEENVIQVQVIDLQGRVLLNETGQRPVSVSSLSSGIFTIIIETDTGVSHHRLIKH